MWNFLVKSQLILTFFCWNFIIKTTLSDSTHVSGISCTGGKIKNMAFAFPHMWRILMGVDALMQKPKTTPSYDAGANLYWCESRTCFHCHSLFLQCSRCIRYHHLHWNLAVTISLTQNYVPKQFGDIELFSLFSL